MKVSLVTACYNSADTLQDTIDSICRQLYDDIEYIVVDGGSTDGTLEIIQRNANCIDYWISEPDNGLYDAMNKGIRAATGDVVGIINSDDFYHRDDAISRVVDCFERTGKDCVYADVRFVSPENLEKTVRYYSSKRFHHGLFKKGLMPAHPTFFTYKKYFDELGYYRTDYRIAADFELLLRYLYKYGLTYAYMPVDLIKMRTGGVSTQYLKNNWTINRENLKACRDHGLYTNYFHLYSRYFNKVFEFVPTMW
ncbi:glycosyltransferase family 2 protein [Echinicola rosea]|uniref:Glycosyl transferase n=1 Tax=Echinicola rosea TaxID=1807691 RepID=A0ABQ1V182_9BACT|nr:glycosyltransferase family 2 protein [Echinicola rosea]GGF31778.1 glycosyl transferase [Echinicola rosea]